MTHEDNDRDSTQLTTPFSSLSLCPRLLTHTCMHACMHTYIHTCIRIQTCSSDQDQFYPLFPSSALPKPVQPTSPVYSRQLNVMKKVRNQFHLRIGVRRTEYENLRAKSWKHTVPRICWPPRTSSALSPSVCLHLRHTFMREEKGRRGKWKDLLSALRYIRK